ncbi:hypothetical protein MMC30_001671 [Trapelia coarctata]|nr:hypothetical protein [Trapelia coarctata]
MGKKRKVLSQEEIWDDSALIQSWDEALAEYNLYHSIHARGERVEDVLNAAQVEEQLITTDQPSLANDNTPRPNNRTHDEFLEDGELEGAGATNSTLPTLGNGLETTPSTQPPAMNEPSATPAVEPTPGNSAIPQVPQEIISSSSHDEALKNLMMSWYWAGYYTGLYEGQKLPKSAAAAAEESIEGQK